MPYASLCLALSLFLALVFAAVAGTNFKKDGDVLAKKKKEVEGFEYMLHNLTFPAVDGHKRVKRLQQAVGNDNSLPLCVMTFNIGTYTFEGGVAAHRDMVIARVSAKPVYDIVDTQHCCSVMLLTYALLHDSAS